MFCPKCGAQNDDNVYHCANCGSPVRAAQTFGNAPPAAGVYPPPSDMPKPDNWLIPAILATVFCGCWPLGVVAIIFAAQVDGKYHQGDYQGAQEAARKAKLFTLLAAILGVVCVGAGFLLWFLGLAASIKTSGGF